MGFSFGNSGGGGGGYTLSLFPTGFNPLASTIKVFGLAGQSNSGGTNTGYDPLVDFFPAGITVLVQDFDGAFKAVSGPSPFIDVRNSAANGFDPFYGTQNVSAIASYIRALHAAGKISNGDTVILVQVCAGGTSFQRNDWSPGGKLRGLLASGLASVLRLCENSTLQGLIWVQGESDGSTFQTARTVFDRAMGVRNGFFLHTVQFFSQLWAEVGMRSGRLTEAEANTAWTSLSDAKKGALSGDAELPLGRVGIVSVNSAYTNGYARIKSEQALLEDCIPGSYFYDTALLGSPATAYEADNLHLTAASQRTIGTALAAQWDNQRTANGASVTRKPIKLLGIASEMKAAYGVTNNLALVPGRHMEHRWSARNTPTEARIIRGTANNALTTIGSWQTYTNGALPDTINTGGAHYFAIEERNAAGVGPQSNVKGHAWSLSAANSTIDFNPNRNADLANYATSATPATLTPVGCTAADLREVPGYTGFLALPLDRAGRYLTTNQTLNNNWGSVMELWFPYGLPNDLVHLMKSAGADTNWPNFSLSMQANSQLPMLYAGGNHSTASGAGVSLRGNMSTGSAGNPVSAIAVPSDGNLGVQTSKFPQRVVFTLTYNSTTGAFSLGMLIPNSITGTNHILWVDDNTSLSQTLFCNNNSNAVQLIAGTNNLAEFGGRSAATFAGAMLSRWTFWPSAPANMHLWA